MPISEAKPGLRPHNPYTGALRDPRDIETDPMGALERHPDEPLRGIEGRAARDMEIAVAVRRACQLVAASFNHCSMSPSEALFKARGEMNTMDLAAIIATVK